MILLTLKLLLAHFLGDFVFQPGKWVEDKLRKKWKSKYLYWHIGIHLLALLVLLQFQHLWIVAVVITSHYLIDLTKLVLTTKKNNRWLFVVDQLLHLSVIALAVYIYEPFSIGLEIWLSKKNIFLLIMIAFVTYVSAILIKLMMSPYIKELQKENKSEGESLKNAGRYIGMLERLFVFGFILFNQWASIGFLITAKSVFRFGDLNKGKNRKLTEYVLIGTLLSFGLSILAGVFYEYLVDLL